MAVNAILHLGFGKCGSSALQKVLSRTPDFVGKAGLRYSYAAITQTGRCLSGAELSRAAVRSPHGYVTSTNASFIAAFKPWKLRALRHDLDSMLSRSVLPIFSNEAWTRHIQLFRQHDLFDRLGLRPQVVVYVRPQVDWLNSAWWQWGAWSGLAFETWLERNIRGVDWWKLIEPWYGFVGRSNVKVRLLPDDIVLDFFSLLNAAPPKSTRNNTSLPGTVLRILQRHRDLRPHAHASALEFALGDHFAPGGADKTPWVIDPSHAEKAIRACRPGNERLLAALDESDREKMRLDQRWWDPAAYAHKPVERAGKLPPLAEQTDAVAANAFAVIQRLDSEIRALRDENLQLRHGGCWTRWRVDMKRTWQRRLTRFLRDRR